MNNYILYNGLIKVSLSVLEGVQCDVSQTCEVCLITECNDCFSVVSTWLIKHIILDYIHSEINPCFKNQIIPHRICICMAIESNGMHYARRLIYVQVNLIKSLVSQFAICWPSVCVLACVCARVCVCALACV